MTKYALAIALLAAFAFNTYRHCPPPQPPGLAPGNGPAGLAPGQLPPGYTPGH